MKHFKWMLPVLLLATAVCFMACTSTKSEAVAEPAATSNVIEIMFNDGTSVAYTSDLSLTEEQKSKAIAVIYKTDGDKAYGVGLVQNTNGLAWCLNSAKGFIRSEIGKRLSLRYIPNLTFIPSDTIEYGINMSKKIDELLSK